MGQASFKIGGNSYTVACRDGEEGHLLSLAAKVDEKAEQVIRSVGNVSEVRQLLLTAILLADELQDRDAPAPAPLQNVEAAPSDFAPIVPVIERLEALATKLENGNG
jgi:cell division protein ZapA